MLIVSFWRILVGDVEMFKNHNNSTAVPDTLISAPRTLPGQCEIKCVQLCSLFTDEWERDELACCEDAVVRTSVVSKGLAFLQFGNTEISWSTSSLCTCCRFIQLLNHPVCLYYKKKRHHIKWKYRILNIVTFSQSVSLFFSWSPITHLR